MLRLGAAAAAIVLLCASAAKAQTVENTAVLNTLGYATGGAVLVTHMAMGTLADAYQGKAYGQTQANNTLDTYINVTNGFKTQMRTLVAQHALLAADSTFIESSIAVLDLLLQEGGDLKTYIRSGTPSDALAYDSSRQKALKAIKILLSIKD